MSIVVIVTFKASDGNYDDLKGMIQILLPQTLKRDGCLLLRAAGDPETNSFLIYEEWDSVESHQAYREWSSQNRDPAALMAILREPPSSQQFEHIF